METKEKTLTISEIARNFMTWRNNDDAARLRAELYSPDIESIEDWNTTEIGRVKGMEGLRKKGEWLRRDFEVHGIKASAPLVGDNWFSIKFEIDTTDKKSGERSVLGEIGVFKVENGKIVKEQYFMW